MVFSRVDRRRRASGAQATRPRRKPLRRHGRQLLTPAARQRHGELREGCPARARPDRAGGSTRRPGAAARSFRQRDRRRPQDAL